MSKFKEQKLPNMSTWWEKGIVTAKGGEKKILSEIVLPNLVRAHIKNYGQIESFIDIGSGDGGITSIARKKLHSINRSIQTIAIEPNPSEEKGLAESYTLVYPVTWEEFHSRNPNKKADMLISSHQLYYLSSPEKGVKQMMEHTNPLGHLYIFLEDYNSGRLKMLREFGVIDLDQKIFTEIRSCMINPDNLSKALSKMFTIHGPKIISVDVLFNNLEEAVNRFKEMLNYLHLVFKDEDIKKVILNNTNQTPEGKLAWQRNTVLIEVSNKN